MKRVFKQKNKPVLSRAEYSSETLTKLTESKLKASALASNEGPRRTRTSAAMIGLAISMGATGLLLPSRSDKAVAAEPIAAEPAPLGLPLGNKDVVKVAPQPTAAPQSTATTPNKITLKLSQPKPEPAAVAKETPLQPQSLNVVIPSEQTQSTSKTPEVVKQPKAVISHQVQNGESLWQISQNHSVKPEAITTSSEINPNSTVQVGQTLQIPSTNGVIHKLQVGETETSVAQSYGVEVEQLQLDTTSPSTSQVVVPGDVDELLKNRQDRSLAILQQRQERLRESLTELQTQQRTAQFNQNEVLEATSPEDSLIELVPEATIQSSEVQALPENLSVKLPVPSLETVVEAESTKQSVVISLPAAEVSTAPDTFMELAIKNEDNSNAQSAQLIKEPTPIAVVEENLISEIYQVKQGDTLDEIANEYGLSRVDLVEVNNIQDPNLININQQIKIPLASEQTPTEQLTLPTAVGGAAPLISQAVSIPVSVAQESEQIKAIETNPSSELNEPGELQQTTNEQYNPYVEKLKADVIRMREEFRRQRQENQTALSEPTTVEIPIAPSLNNANPEPVGVQSQEWVKDRENIEIPISVNLVPNSQPSFNLEVNSPQELPTEAVTSQEATSEAEIQESVIAVAPVPIESYNYLIDTPAGQMVSPELPPLNSPEQYLPGGSQRFNGYVWPTKGVLTSGYGWRWGRMHKGIDIAAPVGTPIIAAAPGEVISAGWNSGGYGNLVKLRHKDGSVTLYAHNSRINVRRGQQVNQGQKIAEMGSTGYSTGPHLHFEVHHSGRGAVNPMAYLPSR